MEEIPSKHDNNNNKNKKKNTKILPVAINIGVGGLGIGGIVFLGGALVAATIVSALAFKTRRQRRRSSSGNMNKSMSSSTDTHSLDAPSDEVTSMEEIKTKNIQSLTPIEEDSCLGREGGGGEEQKDLMLINNENDEHVDANSLVSDEGGMSIEEYVAIEDEDHEETLFKNEATTCMNKFKVEDNLHDEIVLENCEGDLSDETGYGDHIVHEVITEEEKEEEETSRSMNKEVKDAETTQKVEEQVIIADEAAKVVDQADSSPRKLMSKDEKVEIPLVESVKEEQESEEDVIVKVQLRSGVSSFSVQEEPTPEAKINNHKTEETYVQVKVEMIADHELVKKDEIPQIEYSKEDEDKDENVIEKVSGVTSFSSQEQLTPETKIISHKIEETNVQAIANMITDHELVKKDEIPHVESTKEEEDMEEDVAIKDVMIKVELSSGVASSSMQEEPSPESKISNHKIKETVVETITNHKLVKKDEIPHVEYVKEDEDNVKDVTVKVELGSCVRSFSMQKEPTPKEKISNKIEETDAQVKLEMTIDHELVKKDETLHVESIKGDKDSEGDVAVKGVNSSMHEEPTPKEKINNHKIEENMKEDQTFLGKTHNDSDDNEVIKEQAFASESWNLKLVAWFVFISLCCLLGTLLLILILLGYHNHPTNFVT